MALLACSLDSNSSSADPISVVACLTAGTREVAHADEDPWSRIKALWNLKPEDFLPEDYLNQLRTQLGDVQLTSFSRIPGKLYFKVTAAGRHVLNIQLEETPGQNQTLTLEHLRLENPLADRVGLHPGQHQKGLPAGVFDYAKQRLFEISLSSGFTSILTTAPENYTVDYLYRKAVGMKPANENSVAFHNYLDRVFKLARGLPDDERVGTLDDFTRAIINPPNSVTTAWQNYQTHQVALPDTMKVISLDGQPAILIDKGMPQGHRTFFIRAAPDNDQILNWNANPHNPERHLIRELN